MKEKSGERWAVWHYVKQLIAKIETFPAVVGRSTFPEVWVRRSQSLMKHNNYNLLQEGVAATLHSNMLSAHFWKINDNIQIRLDTSVPPGGCSVSVGLKLQPNVGQFSPGHWDCQHGLDQTLQGPSVVLHRIVSRLFTNIKATPLQLTAGNSLGQDWGVNRCDRGQKRSRGSTL